jgi:uncharacterized SAM-dependent methyltransferase
MSYILQKNLKIIDSYNFDQEFFQDMLGVFTGLGRGEAGKYMYNNGDGDQGTETNLWEAIVTTNSDYYIPKADSDLLNLAQRELSKYIKPGTTYIDFGIGGLQSFRRYVVPTMKAIGSNHYHGVDFDRNILDQITNAQTSFNETKFTTSCFDFFQITQQPALAAKPALGVMNGVTIGNMYGALHDLGVSVNLALILKHLMRLAGNGWLLISFDTNQDNDLLERMYLTPLNSKLNIASLHRMELQLPVEDFDSSTFVYEPEWLPDHRLFAHLATSTKNQNFKIGDNRIYLEKNQKIHLFNSYKFPQKLFEESYLQVGLRVCRYWEHDTGVMLYLLSGH